MNTYQPTQHSGPGARPVFPDNGTGAGVAAGGMNYVPPAPKRKTSQCTATTKAGIPCTAPKANQTDLCIGHLRASQK